MTEEGALFLERAREVLEILDEAEEQMAPAGRLRVDAATPYLLHVIIPLVERFRSQYPEVALELNTNEGIIGLIGNRTDVAFPIGPLKVSTLHALPIGTSPLRVLASPDYLALTRHTPHVSSACTARLVGIHPAGFVE